MSICRTWSSLWHFSRNCEEGCQGLDKHRLPKILESLTRLKQTTKGFLQGPSVRRTKELLKLNRNQLKRVTGLLAGHCHAWGYLFKMGLMDSSTCESCLEKDESTTHILCDCEATTYLRSCQLAHYFMEPGLLRCPCNKILHFIEGIGLLMGWNRGGCTTDHWRSQCKGQSRPTPYTFNHFKWHTQFWQKTKNPPTFSLEKFGVASYSGLYGVWILQMRQLYIWL
jgi:hypothetical protein